MDIENNIITKLKALDLWNEEATTPLKERVYNNNCLDFLFDNFSNFNLEEKTYFFENTNYQKIENLNNFVLYYHLKCDKNIENDILWKIPLNKLLLDNNYEKKELINFCIDILFFIVKDENITQFKNCIDFLKNNIDKNVFKVLMFSNKLDRKEKKEIYLQHKDFFDFKNFNCILDSKIYAQMSDTYKNVYKLTTGSTLHFDLDIIGKNDIENIILNYDISDLSDEDAANEFITICLFHNFKNIKEIDILDLYSKNKNRYDNLQLKDDNLSLKFNEKINNLRIVLEKQELEKNLNSISINNKKDLVNKI